MNEENSATKATAELLLNLLKPIEGFAVFLMCVNVCIGAEFWLL